MKDKDKKDQVDQIDELLDDVFPSDVDTDLPDPSGDEPAEPEKDLPDEPEPDAEPDDKPGDEPESKPKDEHSDQPEVDEPDDAGGEGDIEPEPEDELMDYSRGGLLKLIEKEELALEVDDEASEEDIRRAIREERESVANDPAKTVEEMRQWMNEQVAAMQKPADQPADTADSGDQKPSAPAQPAPVAEPVKIELSDEQFEGALQSKEKFTEVLTNAVGVGEQRAMQRLIPMVNQIVQQQTALQTIIGDFYDDNPHLKPYKPFVSFLASQVSSKNPDKDFVSILKEVGVEATKRLRLDEKPPENNSSEPTPPKKRKIGPAFAGGKNTSGNRRGVKIPKLTDQEKQIGDMLDDDEDDRFGIL